MDINLGKLVKFEDDDSRSNRLENRSKIVKNGESKLLSRCEKSQPLYYQTLNESMSTAEANESPSQRPGRPRKILVVLYKSIA